jgi:hypothetical protein
VELQKHPKSRWWWWTLLVLKVKLMEYYYTFRLGRGPAVPKRSIPLSLVNFFWGELPQLVESKKMNDMFFLSRVVWAYSQTAKAHALYHLEAYNVHDLPSRLERIRCYLDGLMTKLESARKADSSVDPSIHQYATACRISGSKTCEMLKMLERQRGKRKTPSDSAAKDLSSVT